MGAGFFLVSRQERMVATLDRLPMPVLEKIVALGPPRMVDSLVRLYDLATSFLLASKLEDQRFITPMATFVRL